MSALSLPQASGLPALLVEQDTWVAVKRIVRDGDPTKFPIDVNPGPHQGRGASWDDPSTHAPFEVARAYAARHGYGVGLYLVPPLFGYDLDGCYDPDAQEFTPIAASVMGEMDTYAEFSMSNVGVKGIGIGEKPGTRCKRKGLKLELYSNKRFFSITGRRVPGTPLAINDCQDSLDHLYEAAFGKQEAPRPAAPRPPHVADEDDQAVIDWLHEHRAPTFSRLWHGPHGNDPSSDDLALCNLLAWRTGDEYRTDRLFRQSGLYRDKWDERRGTQTYGERTIAKAFERRGSFWRPPEPPQSPPSVAEESAEAETPRVAELVQRVIVLEREVERERGLRVQAQKLLAGFIAIRGNPHIKAERDTIAAAIIEAKAEIADGHADGEGYVRQHTQRLADKVGKSPQAAQGHMAKAAAWEFFDRKLVEEFDPETRQRRTVYYIKPKDEPERLLDKLVAFVPPQQEEQPGWGGKRTPCPRCNSIKRRTVTSCADCGLVISERVTDVADDTPTNQEIAEALRAEQRPDEPRADAPSVPPTVVEPAPTRHIPYATEDDEPDDWDPYECNHRGCTRRTLPDKRYCDQHDPGRAAKLAERQGRQGPTFTVAEPPQDDPTIPHWDWPAPILPDTPPAPFTVPQQPAQGYSPPGVPSDGQAACGRCGVGLYRPVPYCVACQRIVDGLPLLSHQRDPLADRGGELAAGGGGV